MIIEQLALWGDEATQEHPATFTTYLADPMPEHEDARRPAAIICGGGSFTHVGVHEKEPVALAFLQAGYQAFTLDYVTSSTGDVSYPNPEADLARMVATVRANAADWRVDPARVVVVGFSAGGFVCASLATSWRGNTLPKLVGLLRNPFAPMRWCLAIRRWTMRICAACSLKIPVSTCAFPRRAARQVVTFLTITAA